MICWVITGAGHFLRETVDLLTKDLTDLEIDIWLTSAAEEVAPRYGVMRGLEASPHNICRGSGASAPGIIHFSSGRYKTIVIAPATSNTIAKCALGIADSLASTYFAQADKCGVRSIFLPTDSESEIVTITPSGKKLSITSRPIDIKHLDDLSKFDRVSVAKSIDELKCLINK